MKRRPWVKVQTPARLFGQAPHYVTPPAPPTCRGSVALGRLTAGPLVPQRPMAVVRLWSLMQRRDYSDHTVSYPSCFAIPQRTSGETVVRKWSFWTPLKFLLHPNYRHELLACLILMSHNKATESLYWCTLGVFCSILCVRHAAKCWWPHWDKPLGDSEKAPGQTNAQGSAAANDYFNGRLVTDYWSD